MKSFKFIAALLLVCAAIPFVATGASSADEFKLTLVSQNSTSYTFSYPAQSGYGYLYFTQATPTSAWVLVSNTNDATKTTIKFAKGSYDYKVAAKIEGPSGRYVVTPPPPVDTTNPTVSMTQPSDGSTVSGTINVSANASDNVGVSKVEFYNDGVLFNTDSTSPYSTTFDTTTVADGSHQFNAKAYDAAGNVGTSSSVSVSVDNVVTPPPPPTCDATASPGQGTANTLLNSLSSGQVGCLRGGTYTASSSNVLDTTHANVTLMSYPGETAVLKGLVIIRSGANGVKLDKLSFNGTGIASNTIQIYADDVVVSNSDITNAQNGRSCMYLGDTSVGIADRPQILNNKFHECGLLANGNQDHAIYAAHVRGGQISGNWFWNIAAYTIHLYPDAQGMLVSHNVIDGGPPSVRGGVIFAGEGTPSSNNIVEQNVVAYSTNYNFESYWGGPVGSGNIARNNCVWAGGSGNFSGSGYTQTGNVVADPMFVDRANRNYNLRPESACVAVVGS